RRGDSVRCGPRLDRLRRPPLERVGLDPAEGRRALLGRCLADDLADPYRVVRAVGVLPLGGTAGQPRQGAARLAEAAPEQATERRCLDLLLPVPRTGGPLLRDPALPLGLPRSLR